MRDRPCVCQSHPLNVILLWFRMGITENNAWCHNMDSFSMVLKGTEYKLETMEVKDVRELNIKIFLNFRNSCGMLHFAHIKCLYCLYYHLICENEGFKRISTTLTKNKWYPDVNMIFTFSLDPGDIKNNKFACCWRCYQCTTNVFILIILRFLLASILLF